MNTRRFGLATLMAALAATLAIAAAPVTAAKKKKRGKAGGKVEITRTVNAQIPDFPVIPPGSITFPPVIPLLSTIDVGKKQSGLRVRDVDVTVQTLGATGVTPGEDVRVDLMSPSGQMVVLFAGLNGYPGAPSVSIGPLTLDDEAPLNLGGGRPIVPTSLYLPWSGRATPAEPLAVMDNGGVSGTWTLIARDTDDGQLSNLVQWTLTITTGKPYKSK